MHYNVYLESDYYYKDNDGAICKGNLSYYNPDDFFKDTTFESVSGLVSGESGKYAQTLLPGKYKSSVNSPDENVYIYIHPKLSKSGAAEAFSHEAYGHAYIYQTTRDREKAAHQVIGLKESNLLLLNNVIEARKETINNFKLNE